MIQTRQIANEIVARRALTPDLIAAARGARLADMAGPALSAKELDAFDPDRLLRTLIERRPQRTSFDLELCREAQRASPLVAHGEWLPWSLLHRDLNVANVPQSAPKATAYTPDATTAPLPLRALGATFVAGFREDFVLPIFATAPEPAVAAETGTANAGTMTTTGSVAYSPKRLAVQFKMSRQALLQSGTGALILAQMEKKLWALAESQMLMGAGTLELTGLSIASGVNEVAGGTDGATLTFAHVCDLERTAAVDTEGAAGYAINPLTRSFLRKTLKASGSDPIFADTATPLLGHRAAVSTLLPSNLSKGTSGSVCSALFYGANWAEYFVGVFGPGVDLLVDPITGAARGEIYITGALYIDAHPLRPTAFSRMLDAKLS